MVLVPIGESQVVVNVNGVERINEVIDDDTTFNLSESFNTTIDVNGGYEASFSQSGNNTYNIEVSSSGHTTYVEQDVSDFVSIQSKFEGTKNITTGPTNVDGNLDRVYVEATFKNTHNSTRYSPTLYVSYNGDKVAENDGSDIGGNSTETFSGYMYSSNEGGQWSFYGSNDGFRLVGLKFGYYINAGSSIYVGSVDQI